MSTNNKTYMSNGHVLDKPPLTVRLARFIDHVIFFFGLYFVSLFSLDPYTTAKNSRFNISQLENKDYIRPRWGHNSGSGGGGGGGPDGPGGGPGSRRIGRVDDVRGPECKSCG